MKIKTKSLFGKISLALISIIPILLWFLYGRGTTEILTDPLHSLGELFGLVGMTMFALTFVLSTRIKFSPLSE